jgi:hypothetical protein
MPNPKTDIDTPHASAPASEERKTQIRGHILVVEDDVMVAAILQSRLKKLGYDVPTTVASGEKA